MLVGHVSGGTLNMSTPAGWTALPGSWPVTEGSASRMYGWSRVLQAGDSAPTISNNGSVTGGWEIVVFRDASSVAQAATATASGTSVTLPTLSGVGAGSALAAVAHVRVASGTIPTNLSPNAAYTEVVDQATSRVTSSANVRMGAAYRLIGSAGAYGGEGVGSDVTGSMIGVLVELAAASVDATVAPDGMSAPVAVGAPGVDGTLVTAPGGVAVPTSVGSPAVDGSLSVSPGGVSAPVALGSPGVSWALSVAPDGVSVSAAVGAPAAGWSAVSAPDGLSVAVVTGGPAVGWSGAVAPDGVSAPVVLGDPVLLGAILNPAGVVVPVEVGVPAVVWAGEVSPDGLDVPVFVGAAGVSMPGLRVPRPDAGAVARPAAVLARPSGGVVTRP
ncbi:hypothetical protein [Micromonospora maritima]|uniref:hypothetical protein n=1 Tax=Micromonospora maritima TaxID=986711 RepID=UPI00157CC583|nr:hypothetical protein [Micromonospora maritima]